MKKLYKGLILTCIAVIVLGYITQPYWTKVEQVVHVNKTERIEESYLVYTDKGVFKNEDSWHYFKFDSSDLYNNLTAGQDYVCKSYGFRNGFFSMYPNLVTCDKVVLKK